MRDRSDDPVATSRSLHVQIDKVFLYTAVGLLIRLNSAVSEGRKEMFYITTHSTHFIYGYMASDIW